MKKEAVMICVGIDWINLAIIKPKLGSRILVCDENGFIDIEDAEIVQNKAKGLMTWWDYWEFGNGTKIVAWAELPPFPKELCNKDANGEMP